MTRPPTTTTNRSTTTMTNGTATCTCRCWDDGDGESGPHLQVDVDEACPQHGRQALPAEWAASDAEAAAYDAMRLATYRAVARREAPGCYDASVIEARAQAGLAAEDAHNALQEQRYEAERAVWAAQATYDRRVAHRSRVLRYYDECPDGDPRRASATEALALVSDQVLAAERDLIAAVEALEALGGVA